MDAIKLDAIRTINNQRRIIAQYFSTLERLLDEVSIRRDALRICGDYVSDGVKENLARELTIFSGVAHGLVSMQIAQTLAEAEKDVEAFYAEIKQKGPAE